MIWFGLLLWHINHCRLFSAKSSLYIYVKYIGFGLVGFYGISIIVGYLMPNPLSTYILNIYDLVGLGWVLWHINHCRLFNAKSSLYIYIKYIWFGLVDFYGVSTVVGYLMPNPLYTYILNIYDLVWFGWVLWHINYCRLFNAKSYLYIKIRYMICKHILLIIFSNEPKLILFHTIKWFQLLLTIQFNICHFFAHC